MAKVTALKDNVNPCVLVFTLFTLSGYYILQFGTFMVGLLMILAGPLVYCHLGFLNVERLLFAYLFICFFFMLGLMCSWRFALNLLGT